MADLGILLVGVLLIAWIAFIAAARRHHPERDAEQPEQIPEEATDMPIDPTLVADLAQDAVDIGTDEHATHWYRIRRTPDVLLQDLRYAGKTEVTTAWQSPRFRALLMANEGYGILALFANRARYEEAVRQAERGRFPEPSREPER